MLSSGVILALGGTLLLVVADNVPSLNVEPACRAAAKMGDSLSLDTALRQCLADEKKKRARPIGEGMDAIHAGIAPALRRHHADRRRPQLCRSARVPADGSRRRPDPTDNDADRECICLARLCFPADPDLPHAHESHSG